MFLPENQKFRIVLDCFGFFRFLPECSGKFRNLSESFGSDLLESCVNVWLLLFCAQVLRDLKLGVDHAQDEEALEEHVQAWRDAAIAFLRKTPPPQEAKKIKKLFRLASYHWLCAVDNALRVMVGNGLSSFTLSPGNRHFDCSGRLVQNQLSICIDQGSVGWCPAFYLLFACQLNLVLHFDVFHRVWNDLKASLVQAGLWDIVLLLCLVFSMNYGPFEGAAFWRQAQDSCESWKRNHGVDCPLFRSLLPRIAKDRGQSADLWNEEWVKSLIEEVGAGRDADTKGPKVSLCRWLGWEHCFDYWSGDFSMRLLHLLYMGISLGYIDHKAETSILRLQTMKAPSSSEAGKQGMKEASLAMKPLRDRCKNTMHMVALILGSPALLSKPAW